MDESVMLQKCPRCAMPKLTPDGLARHLTSIHKVDPPWAMKMAHQIFGKSGKSQNVGIQPPNERNAEQAAQTHKCPGCLRAFHGMDEFEKHVLGCNQGAKPAICSHCHGSFGSMSQFKRHASNNKCPGHPLPSSPEDASLMHQPKATSPPNSTVTVASDPWNVSRQDLAGQTTSTGYSYGSFEEQAKSTPLFPAYSQPTSASMQPGYASAYPSETTPHYSDPYMATGSAPYVKQDTRSATSTYGAVGEQPSAEAYRYDQQQTFQQHQKPMPLKERSRSPVDQQSFSDYPKKPDKYGSDDHYASQTGYERGKNAGQSRSHRPSGDYDERIPRYDQRDKLVGLQDSPSTYSNPTRRDPYRQRDKYEADSKGRRSYSPSACNTETSDPKWHYQREHSSSRERPRSPPTHSTDKPRQSSYYGVDQQGQGRSVSHERESYRPSPSGEPSPQSYQRQEYGAYYRPSSTTSRHSPSPVSHTVSRARSPSPYRHGNTRQDSRGRSADRYDRGSYGQDSGRGRSSRSPLPRERSPSPYGRKGVKRDSQHLDIAGSYHRGDSPSRLRYREESPKRRSSPLPRRDEVAGSSSTVDDTLSKLQSLFMGDEIIMDGERYLVIRDVPNCLMPFT